MLRNHPYTPPPPLSTSSVDLREKGGEPYKLTIAYYYYNIVKPRFLILFFYYYFFTFI